VRESATTARTFAAETRNRVSHRAERAATTTDRGATAHTATRRVQAAIKEHQQDGKWPVYRTAEYTLYAYNQEPEPVVNCAPLRTTEIELQPGETVTDVALEIRSAGWRRRPPPATRAMPSLTSR
jgi:type IV secretory pathway VirB9-like protein